MGKRDQSVQTASLIQPKTDARISGISRSASSGMTPTMLITSTNNNTVKTTLISFFMIC